MPRYVGFLRAINVGRRVVKMDALRAMFSAMKLAEVETFIASGNVLFSSRAADTAALEARIEKQLAKSLGYSSEIFLRTAGELAAIVALPPFPDAELARSIHVGFLRGAPSAAQAESVRALHTDVDDFYVVGREVHWLCRTNINETKVSGPKLARALGGPTTMRNITTVRKLAAKMASPR
jgi:uncharacterized protein (DUF1697 family)